MKKVIVTGAAGFIGSHLVGRLLAEGNRVVGLDNLSSGRLENLAPYARSDQFSLIQCDVSSSEVAALQIWEGTEEIYHLASPASPKFYQARPFETIAVNTAGTKLMLEAADRCGAKVAYSSTSEAYGEPEVHPQAETYRGNVNTWGPRACYDEAKRLGEVICYEHYSRYGTPVSVARIFNTYSAGLRSDDGRVISNFVTQALEERDITVYGDGSQTRSFCYVDDTARGLMLLMAREEANGQIVNLGNPVEYSILEVAEMVKKLTGSRSRIVFKPLPQDDPSIRCPDIGKALRLLGWEPEIPFEEGLKRTIQAYRSGKRMLP